MTGHTGLYPRIQAAGYAAGALVALLQRRYADDGTSGNAVALDAALTARQAADSAAYHDQLAAPYPGAVASRGEANRLRVVSLKLHDAEARLIHLGALDGPCVGPRGGLDGPCVGPAARRRFPNFHEAHEAGVIARPVCPMCGSPNVRGYSDESMVWDVEIQHWLPTSGPEADVSCDDCDNEWPDGVLDFAWEEIAPQSNIRAHVARKTGIDTADAEARLRARLSDELDHFLGFEGDDEGAQAELAAFVDEFAGPVRRWLACVAGDWWEAVKLELAHRADVTGEDCE